MSKYTGVYEASGKFNARIFVNKKQVHLGRYDTPQDAAAAYDAASYVLGRPDANSTVGMISLGRQQRALKVLISKGALEVPDVDTAMENLIVEQTLILNQILGLFMKDADDDD